MTSVRNLSISALTFLTLLLFGFVGCQKETALVNPNSINLNQEVQAELRGCAYSVASLYPKLVNGSLPNTQTGFAIKPDKSTPSNVNVVWKGNRLTAEGSLGVSSFLETTEAAERSKLRKVLELGLIASDPREAHHVVPAQRWGHRVVTIAGLGGFHPTHGFNGVPLSKVKDGGLHGNHPNYNDWVEFQLNEFARQNTVNNDSVNKYYICNNWIQCRLIPEAINKINNAAYADKSVNISFGDLKSQGFIYIGN